MLISNPEEGVYYYSTSLVAVKCVELYKYCAQLTNIKGFSDTQNSDNVLNL
jgi:hypothetical protein